MPEFSNILKEAQKFGFLSKAIALILILLPIILERNNTGIQNWVQKVDWVQGISGAFAKFRIHKKEGISNQEVVLKMTDDINSRGQAYEAQQNKCDWSSDIKLALPLTYYL